MNITLIGMAGAGKSYIGEKIAHKRDLLFLDIDREMEKAAGKPLQSILDELGDEAFIEAEGVHVLDTTSGSDSLLISPGGSIVYSEVAMKHLRGISSVIYLSVPFETIESRVKDVPRGIVGLKGKSLREIYDERLDLYKLFAHHEIETHEKSPEAIVDEILAVV